MLLPCIAVRVSEIGEGFRDFVFNWKGLTYLLALTHSMQQSPSSDANRFSRCQKNSPHFREPENPLPLSQIPTTCPYPEPDRSIPQPHILLPEDLS